MSTSPTKMDIPTPLLNKLTMVRRRKVWVGICVAGLVALVVLLVAMAGAMFVDWSITLYEPTWRLILLLTVLCATGATLLWRTVWAFRQVRKLTAIATDVDREVPQLEERWSTVTEIFERSHDDALNIDPVMMSRVTDEALKWEPQVDPQNVVAWRNVRRPLAALAVVVVVLIGAMFMDWRQTAVLMGRFWSPNSKLSLTIIDGLDDFVVGRGEPLSIEAELTGRTVDEATMFLRPDDRDEERLMLFPRGAAPQSLRYRQRAAIDSFDYRLRAGDGQSDWHKVIVADRPELSAVTLRITCPEYTRSKPTELRKLPEKISAVEGSVFAVAFRPEEAIRSFQLQFGDERAKNLEADNDGWYRWRTTLAESFSLSPILTEPNGLKNSRPPVCRVDVLADQPPHVQIITPDEEISVRPDDTIEIEFAAKDDFGISQAELIVYDESDVSDREPREIMAVDIPLDVADGPKEISGNVQLDLSQFELQDGETISYAVRVHDTRQLTSEGTPTRGQAPQSGLTQDANGKQPDERSSADVADASQGTSQESSDSMEQNESEATSSSPNQPPHAVAAATKQENNTGSQRDSTTENAQSSPQPGGSQANGSTTSPSQNAMASSEESANPNMSNQTNRPPDNMTRRSLDVGNSQAGSSDRRLLTIDRWAGTFDGQSREKIELAIAPVIEELDRHLAQAEAGARQLLDELADGVTWQKPQSEELQSADKSLEKANGLIEDLAKKTHETPYAFVGLTLVDIGHSQITPAREEFWKAKQADDPQRVEPVRAGWRYVQRARQLLAALNQQYEKVRRDYQLAQSVERIKQMYQVYIENAHALLGGGGIDDLGGLQRKMAEFELDDEYLERLKEVLEMRQELMAEFARMLSEDPRLLRRYMDRLRARSKTLRYELAELTDRQKMLAREVQAHETVDKEHRAGLEKTILKRTLLEVEEISTAAAELNERFAIWLPLDIKIEDGSLAEARDLAQQVAVSSRELLAAANSFGGAKEKNADAQVGGLSIAADLNSIDRQAQAMDRKLSSLDAALRRVSVENDRQDLTEHQVRRLAETQQMMSQTDGWMRKINQLAKGNYHLAAEVDQHQLASDTAQLAGKLSDIEAQLAGSLQRNDGTLPEPIAKKAQELLATFDEEVATSQLSAVYALREHEMSSAIPRQQQAVVAMEKAEQQLQELLTMAIKEMDELPVQDPIAAALNDPTLDELLAALEQELDSADDLGIPPRPNNLNIIGDMMMPGRGSSSGMGMVMQLGLANQQLQQMFDQVYEEALQRALKEKRITRSAAAKHLRRLPSEGPKRWLVASELGDELLQGSGKMAPEQYRQAIEQYFEQISALQNAGAENAK